MNFFAKHRLSREILRRKWPACSHGVAFAGKIGLPRKSGSAASQCRPQTTAVKTADRLCRRGVGCAPEGQPGDEGFTQHVCSVQVSHVNWLRGAVGCNEDLPGGLFVARGHRSWQRHAGFGAASGLDCSADFAGSDGLLPQDVWRSNGIATRTSNTKNCSLSFFMNCRARTPMVAARRSKLGHRGIPAARAIMNNGNALRKLTQFQKSNFISPMFSTT